MGIFRSPSAALAGAVLVSIAAACGGGGGSGTGGGGTTTTNTGTGSGGKPSFLVVPGAPADPASEPDSDDHPIEGYAAAMASSSGVIAVGTTTSVYALGAEGAVLLDIVGDEPDLPAGTGQVRAMAAYESGILVAAENGLFFTEGGYLGLSLANAELGPLGITAMTARRIPAEDGGPDETRLAFIAGGAAYELAGGQKIKWTVEGEDGAPTAVFAQEARFYVSFGSRTYEIDKIGSKAYAVKDDIGSIREIACSSLACEDGSLLYFASDAGLVERAADGVYRVFTLAEDGKPAVPVETFALDASKQRLYAIAGEHVLRIRSGEVPDAVATRAAPKSPRRLAVDKAGDVWASEGLSATRLALGTPLSFLTDVRPILHEYCADCHATGTQGAPKRDFESYDDAVNRIQSILDRVTQGTMPPLSYGKKLPKDKILILQDWAVTKAP